MPYARSIFEHTAFNLSDFFFEIRIFVKWNTGKK